jgi:hypothetical protein
MSITQKTKAWEKNEETALSEKEVSIGSVPQFEFCLGVSVSLKDPGVGGGNRSYKNL